MTNEQLAVLLTAYREAIKQAIGDAGVLLINEGVETAPSKIHAEKVQFTAFEPFEDMVIRINDDIARLTSRSLV